MLEFNYYLFPLLAKNIITITTIATNIAMTTISIIITITIFSIARSTNVSILKFIHFLHNMYNFHYVDQCIFLVQLNFFIVRSLQNF